MIAGVRTNCRAHRLILLALLSTQLLVVRSTYAPVHLAEKPTPGRSEAVVQGACCQADFTCSISSSGECEASGGEFVLEGSICSADVCDPVVPCCQLGGCVEVRKSECQAQGGTSGRPGDTCSFDPGYLQQIPEDLLVFDLEQQNVDQPYIEFLGSRSFGIDPGQAVFSQDDNQIYLVEGDRRLSIARESGAIRFENCAELWNLSAPEPTITPQQARQVAIDFVNNNNFAAQPPLALTLVDDQVDLEPVMDKDTGQAFLNHFLVRFDFQVQATQPPDPPVLADVEGAVLDVRVNDTGVIGFYRLWRRLAPGATPVPAVDESTARAIAAQYGQPEAGCPAGLTVKYFVRNETNLQTLLVPKYKASTPFGARGTDVPASDLSMKVQIVPPGVQPLPSCSPVALDVDITGGVPPYTITWFDQLESLLDVLSSDPAQPQVLPDSTIGSGAPFVYEFAGGTHRVQVLVEDQNGEWDEAEIWLEFDPQENQYCDSTPPSSCITSQNPSTEVDDIECVGWTVGRAKLTEDDGLRLTSVRFRGHSFISKTHLPFYRLQTSRLPLEVGELHDPPDDNPNGNLRSTVYREGIQVKCDKQAGLGIVGCYWVDQIPAAAGDDSGELMICQGFYFEPGMKGCVPRDTQACVRWQPKVSYSYRDPSGGQNGFRLMQIQQYFDFDYPANETSALFKAPDDLVGLTAKVAYANGLSPPGWPPPRTETGSSVALFGAPGLIDDIHIRNGINRVTFPGCNLDEGRPYRCAHQHWRWPSLFGVTWGNGNVLTPRTQRVHGWVLRVNPGEDDPPGAVLGYRPGGYNNGQRVGELGRDLMLGLTTTSRARQDTAGLGHWFDR